jgi:hypothetical protein
MVLAGRGIEGLAETDAAAEDTALAHRILPGNSPSSWVHLPDVGAQGCVGAVEVV